jgi:ABC-type Na+ transport system ATPase subunit NatA
MIEARHLVKRYGSTVAVSDLSFSVRPGVVTGFLGPNGAGKPNNGIRHFFAGHLGRPGGRSLAWAR